MAQKLINLKMLIILSSSSTVGSMHDGEDKRAFSIEQILKIIAFRIKIIEENFNYLKQGYSVVHLLVKIFEILLKCSKICIIKISSSIVKVFKKSWKLWKNKNVVTMIEIAKKMSENSTEMATKPWNLLKIS